MGLTKLQVTLLGIFGGICGAAVVIGVVYAFAGKEGDWAGFLGSIISAVVTSAAALFAGRWAWQAVQAQIAKAEEQITQTERLSQVNRAHAIDFVEAYMEGVYFMWHDLRAAWDDVRRAIANDQRPTRAQLERAVTLSHFSAMRSRSRPDQQDMKQFIYQIPVQLFLPVKTLLYRDQEMMRAAQEAIVRWNNNNRPDRMHNPVEDEDDAPEMYFGELQGLIEDANSDMARVKTEIHKLRDTLNA